MRPSVGRIVHFVGPNGTCLAAVVTRVYSEPQPAAVSLSVFRQDGLSFAVHVLEDEETKNPGTWHWPERVE